jgi:hypothetical protein
VAEARFCVSLRATDLNDRCGAETVPWLSSRLDQRYREMCRCLHDFCLEMRFVHPPNLLIVTIASPTMAAEKV